MTATDYAPSDEHGASDITAKQIKDWDIPVGRVRPVSLANES